MKKDVKIWGLGVKDSEDWIKRWPKRVLDKSVEAIYSKNDIEREREREREGFFVSESRRKKPNEPKGYR